MNDAFKALTSRYVDFSSRARRGEFWGFALLYVVFMLVAFSLDVIMLVDDPTADETDMIFWPLMELALILPIISVAVRRLHDLDKSAWWVLMFFVPVIGQIYLLAIFSMSGTAGENRFGKDPLGNTQGELEESYSSQQP